MKEHSSWQEILGKVTNNMQERQRIAGELSISTVTLTRWVTGVSMPRHIHLRKLVQVIPQELRSQFIESIIADFPDGVLTEVDDLDFQPIISSAFYSKVLKTYVSTPPILQSTVISNLVLQQVLDILDPRHFGMLLTILKCMPPQRDFKIHSLRPFISQGTSPWDIETLKLGFFRGVESVEGLVASSGHRIVLQTELEGRRLIPNDWLEFVKSMAAIPILRSESIAGVFCLYSTRSHYFTSYKIELIQKLVNILSIAFTDREFFYYKDINLDKMPSLTIQLSILATFRTRVARYLLEDKEFVGLWQAEKKAWEEIETLLLENAESV